MEHNPPKSAIILDDTKWDRVVHSHHTEYRNVYGEIEQDLSGGIDRSM